MTTAGRGDWVQIYRQILSPGERSPVVPEDTQKVPLEMLLKGFLTQESGKTGEQVTVKTLTGRLVQGKLVQVLPSYTHNFGQPQPELLEIGPELKSILWGGNLYD